MELRELDERAGSTLSLLDVILGLLESCSRRLSVLFDSFNLLTPPQSVDNRRWKIRVRIELNPCVLQERIELRLQSRQDARVAFS
jgi:hypothetical protein